jgi:hypothetical protein
MKMSECRNTGEIVSPASLVLALVTGSQSVIGIPALASIRYRWSRIIPEVPSYAKKKLILKNN